ncbi:MAG TPA: SRPBCC family protein [Kiritimatiellia bacterium]|nr:SRPBCC family protein [Kiritimatiellia bacterium]
MPCSAAELFAWHESPGAFTTLLPPGEPVTVVHHDGHIRNGAKAIIRVGKWPFRFRWELMHESYVNGHQFCDVQLTGPFRYYRHEHVMRNIEPGTCVLSDTITFSMPLGVIGYWIGKWFVMRKFDRLFAFRHDVTLKAIQRHG